MARHVSHASRLFLGLILVLAAPFALAQQPSPSPADALETALEVQYAIATAKAFLAHSQPKLAVDELERHVAKANGQAGYLELLRDGYRAYIKYLLMTNQPALAQRYVQRLVILDPAAGSDPSLRPGDTPRMVPAAPSAPIAEKKETPLPKFTAEMAGMLQPRAELASKLTAVSRTKGPIIRGMMPQDDPFDLSNRRTVSAASPPPPPSSGPVVTQGPTIAVIASGDAEARLEQLLSRANEEFAGKRYAEARSYYEQVVALDRGSLEQVKDCLAYCMLDGVTQQLNSGKPCRCPELRDQVQSAMTMSPKLEQLGNWLLSKVEKCGGACAGCGCNEPDPPLNLQHFGKNPQGWTVTETTNFRIFHNQDREFAERVALIAERTRLTMSKKWLGAEQPPWTPKCELVLHATGADYQRQTNVPSTSPGHSRIETDPTTFRVTGRRIDLHVDTMGILEAILPHEATHVVLAGHFGTHQVPRWADEGLAVLTEPLEKIEGHRRNLAKAQREGQLFGVRELMDLQNYPEGNRIAAFYAESVMLCDFLTSQRGPETMTAFLRDGLDQGYEIALRKHFGWTFRDLQANWDRQVLGETQKLVAGR
jgi:hypothetical protein